MRDPTERLRDILVAIVAIERHAPREQADFERDELIQVWCLRHLQNHRRGGAGAAGGSARRRLGCPLAEDHRYAQCAGARLF